MIYKVLSKGTMVEYTNRLKDAEDAYKDAGEVAKEIFVVYNDGSAKLVKKQLG